MQHDDQGAPMEDEERQQLRELLRAHQSRLRVLELQKAKFGDHTPPHVVTEIAEIRTEVARVKRELAAAMPSVERSTLRQLRQKALTAYYAQEWERAEELLIQLLAAKPEDRDAQEQLDEAQRQLDLRACYQALRDLRDAGNWTAVLVGFDDLDRRQPGYSDTEGLRAWAERSKLWEAVHAAKMHADLPALGRVLDALIQAYPDDDAITLLDTALVQHPGELPIHPNTLIARERHRRNQPATVRNVKASTQVEGVKPQLPVQVPPEPSTPEAQLHWEKATPTITGTSPRTPYPNEVFITKVRSGYEREESGGGHYSFWGEMINGLAHPIYNPAVTVTFYDANNNLMPVDADRGFSLMKLLDSQAIGPFHYQASGPARTMDRIAGYEITATYTTDNNGWVPLPFDTRADSATYQQVIVHNPYDYDIQGFRLIVTTYEAESVYEAWEDFVGNKLYSGGTWTFNVRMLERPCRLQAEGRRSKEP